MNEKLALLLDAAQRGDVDLIRRLRDEGTDLNMRDADGWTPLMSAANLGQFDSVQTLLRAGADPTLAEPAGLKASDLARSGGFDDVAKLLDGAPAPQRALVPLAGAAVANVTPGSLSSPSSGIITHAPDLRPAISAPASGGSVVALGVNLFIPGLGTILGGRGSLGAGQLALFASGALFAFLSLFISVFLFPLGLLPMLGAWIWGIVTGVQMISSSSRTTLPPQ